MWHFHLVAVMRKECSSSRRDNQGFEDEVLQEGIDGKVDSTQCKHNNNLEKMTDEEWKDLKAMANKP